MAAWYEKIIQHCRHNRRPTHWLHWPLFQSRLGIFLLVWREAVNSVFLRTKPHICSVYYCWHSSKVTQLPFRERMLWRIASTHVLRQAFPTICNSRPISDCKQRTTFLIKSLKDYIIMGKKWEIKINVYNRLLTSRQLINSKRHEITSFVNWSFINKNAP